ncbi:MAG: VIT1/CCC1 transporter family protein, partial [Candidatus Saccharimonadales bacterium]
IKGLLRTDRARVLAQITKSLHHDDGQKNATVQQAVQEIAGSDRHVTNIYARHVMGFNPDELGSPWVAAGSSFALFTLGALVPLAPWLVTSQSLAIWSSIILTAIAGLIVGGYIGQSSGKSIVYGALRQLGVIVLAAVVTYGIGHVLGVSVG